MILSKRHLASLLDFLPHEKELFADILRRVAIRYDNLFQTLHSLIRWACIRGPRDCGKCPIVISTHTFFPRYCAQRRFKNLWWVSSCSLLRNAMLRPRMQQFAWPLYRKSTT